jgi:hypothetical protein
MIPTERQLMLQPQSAVHERKKFLSDLCQSVQSIQQMTARCKEFIVFYRWLISANDGVVLFNSLRLPEANQNGFNNGVCGYLSAIAEARNRLIDHLMRLKHDCIKNKNNYRVVLGRLKGTCLMPYFIKTSGGRENINQSIEECLDELRRRLNRQRFINSCLEMSSNKCD